MPYRYVISFVFLLAFFLPARAQVIQTIAGNGIPGDWGNGGPAIAAELNNPIGLAIDKWGNVYFTQSNAYMGFVRKINSSGIITAFAGNGGTVDSGDGGPATAAGIRYASGIAADGAGNIYITENSGRIRIVNSAGIISTFAGNGHGGHSGDGGPATAAGLSAYAIATDGAGNVFFTDAYYIREVFTSGIITTIAGNGVLGYSGDNGPATLAQFGASEGIAVDGAGNVYIADGNNDRIRKVSTSGIMTTFAGTGVRGFYGDGGSATAAQLDGPTTVTADGFGNVYIGDIGNDRVRKVDPAGIITTIAGTGTRGFSGDGGPATAAHLGLPYGLVMNGPSDGYIADLLNNRIRKIFRNSVPYFVNGKKQTITVCENSGADSVNALLAIVDSNTLQTETWGILRAPAHGILLASATRIANGDTLTSTGLYYKPASGYSGNDSFKVVITDSVAYDTTTVYVTVNPVSAISGGTAACMGGALALSDAAGGGTWNSSNTTAAPIGTSTGIVSGNALGTASITYTTTTGCTATTTVTVNPAALPITGITSVCAGAISALTDAAGGAWRSSNTTVATVGGSGIFSGVKGGTATITYTLATGCYATAGVNVFAVPVAITGPAGLCPGGTTLLSDATAGGTWSSNNTSTATVGTGSGMVSGIAPGTATITYATGAGCAAAKTVTVNPLPGAITGSSDVCRGATTILSDAGGGTWALSAGSGTGSVGRSTGAVTGITAGTVTVTYTLATGCTTTTIMTIDAPPSKITGPGSVCAGLTIALSESVGGGTWSSGSGAVSVGSASGIVTGLSGGTAIIGYTTGAGCSVTALVTVLPAVHAITGATPMCAGTDQYVYDIDMPSGTWTSTGVTISTGGLVSAFLPGTGTITYTLPTGCQAVAPITINPLPAAIAGGSSVCAGLSTTLSDGTGGGAWSAGGSISVGMTTGVVSGITVGTGVVSYTLTTGCMTTDTITVYPVPIKIAGAGKVCAGSAVTLSDSLSGGIWTSTAGSGSVGVGSVSGIVSGIAIGTATVTYTTAGGCMADLTMSVLTLPTIYAVSGGGSFCAGGAGVDVQLGGSDTATRYDLFDGLGMGSLSGTDSILDFGAQTVAGTYIVVATNTVSGCSNTMADSAVVIVKPVHVPAVNITAVPGDTVCAGGTVSFTATPVNGGTLPTYHWWVDGADVGVTGTAYNYTPIDGDVVVVLMTSNASCPTPAVVDTYAYMTVVAPIAPAVSITEDPGTSISYGQSVTFTATVTNGIAPVTYQWLLNNTPLPGEINATYTSSSLVNNDTVSCVVTGVNGPCSTVTTGRVGMNVNNVGTSPQPSPKERVSVFPNPVKDELTVAGGAGCALKMYDVLGQEVFSASVVTDKEVLHFGYLASGVYVVRITGKDGGVTNVRVVKE